MCLVTRPQQPRDIRTISGGVQISFFGAITYCQRRPVTEGRTQKNGTWLGPAPAGMTLIGLKFEEPEETLPS
jgi:hypothetical protein